MKILPRNRWTGKRYTVPSVPEVGIMTVTNNKNGKYLCCTPDYHIKERMLTENNIIKLIESGYWKEIK